MSWSRERIGRVRPLTEPTSYKATAAKWCWPNYWKGAPQLRRSNAYAASQSSDPGNDRNPLKVPHHAYSIVPAFALLISVHASIVHSLSPPGDAPMRPVVVGGPILAHSL